MELVLSSSFGTGNPSIYFLVKLMEDSGLLGSKGILFLPLRFHLSYTETGCREKQGEWRRTFGTVALHLIERYNLSELGSCQSLT